MRMEPAGTPYFLSNPDWYTVVDFMAGEDTEDDRGYHIRDDAPEEAKRSYEEFYRLVEMPLDVRGDRDRGR